ncbi:zinc-dependent alcohol dehydrogenase family protein [Paenibacillus sp. IB182496]|uniref:Zinc-dependent alcohol dehydrogenase family protein n=1 Tax=Paenibacillus sabuli TaxID=2772509 RepID=A0A927GRU0_9BACL|nr:zinc-dependent alcohol dehydrogenase family protein [Paenibacillus sabuli]MBD2845027.1 zinc-dependent alcohol dehydrogenase family protein [Paenibacillus sabuli]
MRAAILTDKKQMELKQAAELELGPKDVRLEVKACGICGTDQHIYHGQPGSAAVTPPIVLGHELSGIVAAVGSEVKLHAVGDRVSVDPNIYCGSCVFCRKGIVQLCDNLQAIGVTRDGGMGESCVVPEANCYRMPDHMSYVAGALAEPLGCVLHGLKKLTVRPSDAVLVIGGGFIGQLFVQLLRSQGRSGRLAVSEPIETKHQSLLELGASEIIGDPSNIDAVRDTFDIVIECVGRRQSMETALQAAAKGGQVLLFGVAAPHTEVTLTPYHVFVKELRIMGSFINPYTHLDALGCIAAGDVDVEGLVSHRFALDEVPDMMARYPQLEVTKGIIVY